MPKIQGNTTEKKIQGKQEILIIPTGTILRTTISGNIFYVLRVDDNDSPLVCLNDGCLWEDIADYEEYYIINNLITLENE